MSFSFFNPRHNSCFHHLRRFSRSGWSGTRKAIKAGEDKKGIDPEGSKQVLLRRLAQVHEPTSNREIRLHAAKVIMMLAGLQ